MKSILTLPFKPIVFGWKKTEGAGFGSRVIGTVVIAGVIYIVIFGIIAVLLSMCGVKVPFFG